MAFIGFSENLILINMSNYNNDIPRCSICGKFVSANDDLEQERFYDWMGVPDHDELYHKDCAAKRKLKLNEAKSRSDSEGK